MQSVAFPRWLAATPETPATFFTKQTHRPNPLPNRPPKCPKIRLPAGYFGTLKNKQDTYPSRPTPLAPLPSGSTAQRKNGSTGRGWRPYNTSVADYEILEHTADIGFRATAATPAELFRNAALAMMAIAVDPATLSGNQEKNVDVSGDGYPDLLVNWLSEVLYLFDSDEFAGRDFRIDEIDENHLRAALIGEPRDPQRHTWELIIKAITYHQLKVEKADGRWQAEVFLDI